MYAQSGATITHLYTSHDWDSIPQVYFAPYRHYGPEMARWLLRDPLGMVDGPNLYMYSFDSPIVYADVYGLSVLPSPNFIVTLWEGQNPRL